MYDYELLRRRTGFYRSLLSDITSKYSGLFSGGERRADIIAETDEEDKDSKEKSKSFAERWGWYQILYEVAGDDIIIRNAWLDTEVIDFLNHVSFKREKQQQ